MMEAPVSVMGGEALKSLLLLGYGQKIEIKGLALSLKVLLWFVLGLQLEKVVASSHQNRPVKDQHGERTSHFYSKDRSSQD